MSAGLVQGREEFILPNDAYPRLQNAYVWRERILRKKGYQLLGRLQRQVTVNVVLVAGSINLVSAFSLEPTSSIVIGSISLVGGTDGTTYTDPSGNGTLTATGGTGTGGTINYATGLLSINAGGAETLTGTIQYYPGLPVMGIRVQEQTDSAFDQTIVFDQKYAYKFNAGTNTYQEFIPGTTWNASNTNVGGTDFFWSTNYWTSSTPIFSTVGKKLFWVTNNTGQDTNNADPPRITDGTTWVNFYPSTWSQIDTTNFLINWAVMLPFRGRMVVFNTWEGANPGSSQNFFNRIRWSTIGNPFIAYAAGPPATGSWRDDVRGQGGFLDIPINEDIVSVGFVRDNLVIYCERTTWQLRYTGNSVAPFQVERVNSELGVESAFSAVQFDTSLVGIGDKGIVECNSYNSERIDIKIPDFVFQFNATNNGVARVQGIRDFQNRLAFWTVPIASEYDPAIPQANQLYPNFRLSYNYENDSWALFNDSLTALGNYQTQSNRTWLNTAEAWINCPFPWVDQPSEFPAIIGGNQQGFVEYLDETTVNDVSLYISNITNDGTGLATITCPNHNMTTNFVIGISGIPATKPGSGLNGGVYGIDVIDQNTFTLYSFNSQSQDFDIPVTASPAGTYIGGGLINIRENFYINSKKFNFLDEGQNIQLGYLDILMSNSPSNGAISLNVYLDYDDQNPSNTFPCNVIDNGNEPQEPDDFFNTIIPTTNQTTSKIQGTKFWQRVYCSTRANFLTLQYTLSNAQMAGIQQQQNVQIDAQVLWLRKAGRMTNN